MVTWRLKRVKVAAFILVALTLLTFVYCSTDILVVYWPGSENMRLRFSAFWRSVRLSSKRKRLLAIVVLAWIIVLWISSLSLPESGRQLFGNVADITNYSEANLPLVSAKGFNQKSLDYFATHIDVNYTVLENFYQGSKVFAAEVTLTNNGRRTFPGKNWSIFFCQPYTLQHKEFPYPKGLVKKEYGVRLFSHGGGLYSMEPTDDFGDVEPGRSKGILLISRHHNIANTDNYPNWYIAVKGLESRIIENTRGEDYSWVSEHDSPATWKRVPDKSDKDFDQFDPFTPQVRYDKFKVTDMKRAPVPVLPSPAVVDVFDPSTTLNVFEGKWVIVTSQKLAAEANYLSDVWSLPVVLTAPSERYILLDEAEVSVRVDNKVLPTDEAYELVANPKTKTINIKAAKPAGCFYAIQSLLSIADVDGNIPKIDIQDAPRYEYRGFMIDVARNFQSKEKILRYIDLMAMYKLNKLHLHLTDDEGWRLEIPGLPELTTVGATRCHDLTESKCLLPYLGSGPFPGAPGTGHYTVEDYREILRYASLHHVQVIPEIDVPGHSHAAIRAMMTRYRRLVNNNASESSRFLLQDMQDRSYSMSIQGFINNNINPCLQSAYSFISRVLNSVYAMHRDVNPLKIFHFGGDEVAGGAWQRSPVCEQLKKGGVKTPLDEYLARQISNMTSLYGLDLAGWEDGLVTKKNHPMERSQLRNRNVYAYTWNNVWEWGNAKRAYDLANNGYKVVLSPATNLYFDHPYEPDPQSRGLSWASRYTDTKQVFSFVPEYFYWNAKTTREGNPINICNKPENCPPLKKPENIAGIQGSLFGELLRTQEVTDHMLIPRLLALAERAWHKAPWESVQDKVERMNQMEKDWEVFANTLGHKELARMDKMGYRYRLPPPGAIVESGMMRISVTFPGLGVEISKDEGASWTPIADTQSKIRVAEGDNVWLRTRAPNADRYSRVVKMNSRSSKAGDLPKTSVWAALFASLIAYFCLILC